MPATIRNNDHGIQKNAPGWSDVKAKLANFDRTGLISNGQLQRIGGAKGGRWQVLEDGDE